jgi:hypothetical protein
VASAFKEAKPRNDCRKFTSHLLSIVPAVAWSTHTVRVTAWVALAAGVALVGQGSKQVVYLPVNLP